MGLAAVFEQTAILDAGIGKSRRGPEHSPRGAHSRINDCFDGRIVNRPWRIADARFMADDGISCSWNPISEPPRILCAGAGGGDSFPGLAAPGHWRALSSIGVLVSSLVFSLAHAGSHGITLLGFVNLFLFGTFAAFYALAERGLWGIGAWHAVWNWTMGDLLGFATDGTPHAGLRSIRTDGPDVISGGAFGLEGGLACTAVFLIAIGIIAMRARRSSEAHFTAVS